MKTVLTIFFVVTICRLQAQSAPDSTAISDPDFVYDMADVASEPIGGMEAFVHALAKNIHYPADARKQNITGKVIVQFVIEKGGEILPENVKVVRPVFQSLDDEARRVILLSSPWQPGVKNGQPVRTRKTLPISFKLGSSSRPKKNK
jgi:protein TonB